MSVRFSLSPPPPFAPFFAFHTHSCPSFTCALAPDLFFGFDVAHPLRGVFNPLFQTRILSHLAAAAEARARSSDCTVQRPPIPPVHHNPRCFVLVS